MEKQQRDNKIKMLFRKHTRTQNSKPKVLTSEQKKTQIKKWTTFYRRNIEIYIEDRLQISLKPFQRIMLHLMHVSNVFFAICSRGLSKTFTVATYAVAVCMLYPYSKVVITASTLDQAAVMVREKIEGELIGKLSPVLQWMYEKQLIKIKSGKDAIEVKFEFNGSTIQVLPPLDTSRGRRATVLIYEECRLLKRSDIESIFDPMKQPRQAVYLQLDEYANDSELLEEPTEIYITSARFKIEWFWTKFKEVLEAGYTDKHNTYSVFAGDIFTAIKYGLKTMNNWRMIQRTNNDLDKRMEYLNEMVGEVEDAYFTFELFRKCQTLNKAFRPPTNREFIDRVDFNNRVKLDNEIRILAIDFAFANSVKGGEKNDNTIIQCIAGNYAKGHITRKLEYLETLSGGDSETTLLRIRELFWDYKADYIVLDLRSGGEVMYNDLTKPYTHTVRDPQDWNEHGFCVVEDMNLQLLAENKIKDLRERAIDTEPIPCIIPIQGTPELNSTMWQKLRRTMADGYMKLLMDDAEHQADLEKHKWYLELDSREKMLRNIAFVQNTLLVNEGINLKPQWREGKLKLVEPRNGTKDRMVSLSYGNYFFGILEAIKAKNDQIPDYNEEDWKNIFIS